jgi:hypothetical protein
VATRVGTSPTASLVERALEKLDRGRQIMDVPLVGIGPPDQCFCSRHHDGAALRVCIEAEACVVGRRVDIT